MSLLQQVQGVIYSFCSGLFFSMIYAFINRLFYRFNKSIFRTFIQIILGSFFGFIYYFGFVYINNGIIRIYYMIFFIGGYFIYHLYYAYHWLVFIEYIMKYIKIILFPLLFIFRNIRGILLKVKKVITWQKKQQDNLE